MPAPPSRRASSAHGRRSPQKRSGSSDRIAWKLAGADQYIVWTTDGVGNYQTQTAVLSGTSYALETYETSFGQDLNGDGTTGVVTTVIETAGIYGLVLVADTYWMGWSYGWAELRYGGAPVTVGQFGSWAPIALEPGLLNLSYKVVWKQGATDQYTVWTTDPGLVYVSQTGVLSGGTLAFQSLETTFSQDLNGDGTVGPAASTIELSGSTKLMKIADTYALYAAGGSSGPQLHFNGATVTSDMFGEWTPIGAEAVAGDYQVVWKQGGADQYAVWLSDAYGNLLSSPTGVVSGSSVALQSAESGFGQDLNGDGTTGLVTTAIEAFGSITLVQIANTYALHPSGSSSGPGLRFDGSSVTAGQFGAWNPIAAEATAGGYQVAWKMAAPTSTRCGSATPTATFCRTPPAWCPAAAWRCSQPSPASARTSMAMARPVLSPRRSKRSARSPWSRSPVPMPCTRQAARQVLGCALTAVRSPRASSAPGTRSPRKRRRPAIRWRGRWPAPTSIRCGQRRLRQPFVEPHGGHLWKQSCAAITGGELPPGSQWRRDDGIGGRADAR